MFLQFEVCLQSALHSHLVVLQPSPHTICPYHFRAPRSSFRANRFIKPSACGCSAYHWGSDGDSWNWQPNWVCTLTFKLTFRSIGFRRLWSCWKLPFWCPIFNFRGVPYGWFITCPMFNSNAVRWTMLAITISSIPHIPTQLSVAKSWTKRNKQHLEGEVCPQ